MCTITNVHKLSREREIERKIVSVLSLLVCWLQFAPQYVSSCAATSEAFPHTGVTSTHGPAACASLARVRRPPSRSQPIAHTISLCAPPCKKRQCLTLNMAIGEHVRWAISPCCQAAALFMAVSPAAPAAVAFCSSSMSTKGTVHVCTNTSCRKVCLVCDVVCSLEVC